MYAHCSEPKYTHSLDEPPIQRSELLVLLFAFTRLSAAFGNYFLSRRRAVLRKTHSSSLPRQTKCIVIVSVVATGLYSCRTQIELSVDSRYRNRYGVCYIINRNFYQCPASYCVSWQTQSPLWHMAVVVATGHRLLLSLAPLLAPRLVSAVADESSLLLVDFFAIRKPLDGAGGRTTTKWSQSARKEGGKYCKRLSVKGCTPMASVRL